MSNTLLSAPLLRKSRVLVWNCRGNIKQFQCPKAITAILRHSRMRPSLTKWGQPRGSETILKRKTWIIVVLAAVLWLPNAESQMRNVAPKGAPLPPPSLQANLLTNTIACPTYFSPFKHCQVQKVVRSLAVNMHYARYQWKVQPDLPYWLTLDVKIVACKCSQSDRRNSASAPLPRPSESYQHPWQRAQPFLFVLLTSCHAPPFPSTCTGCTYSIQGRLDLFQERLPSERV